LADTVARTLLGAARVADRRDHCAARRTCVHLSAVEKSLMNLLELRDVHFSYAQPVLAGVTLDVRAGEIVALLGPNGAGKSTLLNLAHGLLQPQRGAVWLNGKPLVQWSRREIARHLGAGRATKRGTFPLTALEFALAGRFAHAQGFGFEAEHDVTVAWEALQATDAAQFA
jgi:iron complex transport system ATP-binding protein